MVESSTGSRKYKVSYGNDGAWGCSCPAWKFRREECKHISEIIQQVGRHPSMSESPYQKPMYVVSNDIGAPYYDSNTNELRVPHGFPGNPLDAEHLEINICAMMLENGYSIREVRSIRGLDATWTIKDIEYKYKVLGDYSPKEWTPKQTQTMSHRSNKKRNDNIRKLMILGE